MRLAKAKYGCGTLHRCLEAGDDSQKMQLGMAVGRNARPMATDAHGNYILQNVMAMDKPPPKEAAIDALSGALQDRPVAYASCLSSSLSQDPAR